MKRQRKGSPTETPETPQTTPNGPTGKGLKLKWEHLVKFSPDIGKDWEMRTFPWKNPAAVHLACTKNTLPEPVQTINGIEHTRVMFTGYLYECEKIHVDDCVKTQSPC